MSPEVLTLVRSADCLRWNSGVRVSQTSPSVNCRFSTSLAGFQTAPTTWDKFRYKYEVPRLEDQRLVKVDFIHALSLRGLGFGFSFLQRNDGLAQFADLTECREVSEARGMDNGTDSGVLLTGERVHKVTELFDVDALAVKKAGSHSYVASSSINTSEIGLGTVILPIAIRTVLSETTATQFERKQGSYR